MRISSIIKPATLVVFIIGGVAGLAAALLAEQLDHFTSTDEFCTSCHSMGEYIANSDVYRGSVHQTTQSGVRPGCADCHIPKGLVQATYTHIVNGASDLLGEIRHNYDDPKVWKARRAELAYSARDWMRANDSVTCRQCHEQQSVNPQRTRGQFMHLFAERAEKTCIDCHFNLVHDPVPPRKRFLVTSEK